MASSEVQICNQALSWLGVDRIAALSENSAGAIFCNANYELLRDAVLNEKEWTFAVSRIEPAQLASQPLYGFDQAYQIPPNVLRVLQVSGATTDVIAGGPTERSSTGLGRMAKVEWVREGDQILANSTRIYARVLLQITDVTKFDSTFVQALAARIAMEGAIPLRESKTLYDRYAGIYGEKVNLAGSVEGRQGRSQKHRSTSLTDVR